MKKRGLHLGILLLGSIALWGCGRLGGRDEGTGLNPRVGSKVPDAYRNYGETEVTEEVKDVKAKGFHYDKDNMDYRLVWSDEFEYEGKPDETKWGYDVGGSGWGNQELQYYTDNGNAWVEDGRLVIELRKEEMGTREYTSARLVTKNKGDWKYGRIEIRAKVPTGLGTWPAIWMLPTDYVYGGWPASGEIDIMEHVGYQPDVIHGTVHTQSYYHGIGTQKGESVSVEGVSEDYHIYSVEWLPDQLIISMDGEEYFRFEPVQYKADPTFAEWPFDERMHLLLNIAFGGSWGGAGGINDSVLPVRMEVDYVRVYQSPQVSQVEQEEKDVEDPFLKADGKVLRNGRGTGDMVQLKGTNAGGYLFQEFWMTPTRATSGIKDETALYAVLTERFGKEKMEELIDIYQDHYWTEADFDYCRELGMNCIRLPFWYRNIVDEDGVIIEDWYQRFDWFVEEAAKRQIYVILDFHGAPGSQNGSDHSGKDGGSRKEEASEFFFGEQAEKNQELFYQIWEEIAGHYNGNTWIAGYDLLNEPYCTYRYHASKTADQLHELLWDIYDTAYDRIREIDAEHVIIMEATWDPIDLPEPSRYQWENVMYQYHNYLYDDYDNKEGKQIANMLNKLYLIASADYHVPSLLGEFNYFENPEAWDAGMQLVNNTGISWTTWTYKVVSEYGNWGLRNQEKSNLNLETASYEEIKEFWMGVGESWENGELREVLEKYYRRAYITNR